MTSAFAPGRATASSPNRRGAVLLAVVLLASVQSGGIAAARRAQAAASATASQAAQAPVYKSGVELIAVDVSIVDKTGAPVRSLRADQFDVTVDGKPRRVVSAELVDHASAAVSDGAKTQERARPAYSSNDSASPSTPPGRLIFIVVDQGTFRPAGARAAIEAARRFVDRLQPTDRVGLLAFPPPGPAVAASKNHAAVRAALANIIGSAEALRPLGRTQVSISEAIDIVSDDSFTLSAVVARECSGAKGPELQICTEDVRQAAQSVEMAARMRTLQSVAGIRSIVEGLAAIPERKTLVLISAGFPSSDRPGGGELNVNSEIAAIARRAERANANLYVLHVDSTFLDAFSAETQRINETVGRDSMVLASALENIASASGGTLFRVVSGADTAFDRILKETAASYLLGLEPVDADRDGKPHAIRVSVKAPGAQVRSRREFILPAAAAASSTPADPLVAALSARRPMSALPLGVSTHTVGPEPQGRLRVALTTNVGRSLPGPTDFKMAFVVSDGAGKVVLASPPISQRLTVPAGNDSGSAAFLTTMALPPGDYTLRFAAVDGSGRSGSVDHPFSVRLATGEGITMSDLMLFYRSTTPGEKLLAVADGRLRAGLVNVHLEVFGKTGTATPSVVFGVADTPDGALLLQGRADVSKRDAQGRSNADGVLDLGLLPPGDYFVVAAVSDGKRRIGSRYEPLHLEPAAAATAPASGDAAPRVRFFLGDSTALVKRFARADVLAPGILRHFADRLQSADPNPSAAAAPALADLRSGRLDAILPALREAPSDSLSVAFLKGIGLLAKGDLEPAAREFREAIRIADDFLPAAFYLGACYAEGGRVDEAVGAWQTALVTEGEARIVYDVLADALLRLEDGEQTLAVLDEARGRWPEDETFVPRRAVAQAMLGRRPEALATLEGYLEKHRNDTEAAALAIRLIYEAHAAGRTVTSAEADRAAAARYGEWYHAAGGQQQGLVDRWLAFIAKQ